MKLTGRQIGLRICFDYFIKVPIFATKSGRIEIVMRLGYKQSKHTLL